MAQLADLPVVVDARFADHRHAVRHARRQLTGAVQIDAQIAQIAVVDADHARFQRDRALQLFFTDHFGQHAHVQAVGHRRQLAVLLVGQHRQHQQDGVGLIVARQVNLIRIDDKVFAQHRLADGFTDQRQEIEAALEVFLVGQHRDRRGEIFIHRGDLYRIKVLANQPLGRRGLLAFENESRPGALQRVIEAAFARYDVVLKAGQGLLLLSRRDPLRFVADNLV